MGIRETGKLIGALFFLLLLASTADAAKHRQTYVMCRNKKIVRTIRVEMGSNTEANCETLYTKAGVDRVVGNGVNKESCERVVNNIRGNLEAAAWKCRDISAKSNISVATSKKSPGIETKPKSESQTEEPESVPDWLQ